MQLQGCSYASRWGIVLLLLISSGLFAVSVVAQTEQRCFSETDYCISGPIRSYWEQNGGLPVFGYPITEQRTETVEDRTIVVQWFERDRLEIQADGTVTAGRLGARALELQGRPWRTFPTVDTAPADCRYFAETQHTLCPPFRAYWEQNGGLERFGYPITQPMQENLGIRNGTHTVQYFERRRMEHHPANDPPADVLLGRLGAEVRILLDTPITDTSGRIAFTSTRTGEQDIWVMNADGSGAYNVTTNPAQLDFNPDWSPDGQQLAFVRGTAPAERDIWIINADGSGARQLTTSAANDFAPTWSADGTRIAFVSDRTGDLDIFVRNADGSGEARNLTSMAGSAQYAPDWSPDGRRIAYVSDTQGLPNIWLMDADGSNATDFTNGDGVIFYDPTWSPDNRQLLYTFALESTPETRALHVETIDPNGRRPVEQLPAVTYRAPVLSPAWSPDGTSFVYAVAGDIYAGNINDPYADFQVLHRNLTGNSAWEETHPAWEP
jgi:Tol biopolymer transport system component